MEDLGISKIQSHRYQKLARIKPELFEKKIEEYRLTFQEPTTSGLLKPHVSNNSGENEWYTPNGFIWAAKQTMGNIDLDPASSESANMIVNADKYFDAIKLWINCLFIVI